jgi:septum site-determining protein MinC
MSSIRGRGRNLEIAVDRALPEAAEELRRILGERPEFYRGSRAVANLGALEPPPAEIAAFRDLLGEFGVTLDGVAGPESLASRLAGLDLAYVGPAPVADVSALPRSRAPRTVTLSDDARSLVADFAGARADLAKRRQSRGVAPSNAGPATASAAIAPPPAAAPAGVATLYHRGTLRGGQALHNLGNIIVIGDVNPGAELIASGDIVVFGALRGVAHAGAQGDRAARVIALDLAPTQLRIATCIALDAEPVRPQRGPEHAYIIGDRIAIVPHASAEFVRREASIS